MNHYNKATELDPVNMTYYTNRAGLFAFFSLCNLFEIPFFSLAVYFEQKRWDECMKECEKAIEVGRENKADYKLIAK